MVMRQSAKKVIASALMGNPKLLLLEDPTRGVDVGAKWEIYQLTRNLSAQGCAVILTGLGAAEAALMFASCVASASPRRGADAGCDCGGVFGHDHDPAGRAAGALHVGRCFNAGDHRKWADAIVGGHLYPRDFGRPDRHHSRGDCADFKKGGAPSNPQSNASKSPSDFNCSICTASRSIAR